VKSETILAKDEGRDKARTPDMFEARQSQVRVAAERAARIG
jgi:hypothetical protein